MTKFNRAELVTAINPDVPGIVSNTLGAAGIPTDTSAALFSRMIDSQAIMLATNDFYQSATVLMLGSIGIIWLIKKPKGPLQKMSGH